jgi:hypothetical protein
LQKVIEKNSRSPVAPTTLWRVEKNLRLGDELLQGANLPHYGWQMKNVHITHLTHEHHSSRTASKATVLHRYARCVSNQFNAGCAHVKGIEGKLGINLYYHRKTINLHHTYACTLDVTDYMLGCKWLSALTIGDPASNKRALPFFNTATGMLPRDSATLPIAVAGMDTPLLPLLSPLLLPPLLLLPPAPLLMVLLPLLDLLVLKLRLLVLGVARVLLIAGSLLGLLLGVFGIRGAATWLLDWVALLARAFWPCSGSKWSRMSEDAAASRAAAASA